VRVRLTVPQVRQLMRYFDRVRAAAALGSPGMLVGQIYQDTGRLEYYIDVGFLEHDKALSITEAARREIP
jgi:hypothetical protein